MSSYREFKTAVIIAFAVTIIVSSRSLCKRAYFEYLFCTNPQICVEIIYGLRRIYIGAIIDSISTWLSLYLVTANSVYKIQIWDVYSQKALIKAQMCHWHKGRLIYI